MKKFNLLCLGLMAGATLAGCSDDTLSLDNSQKEQYVRDFIERFGLPEMGHTFSMATRNGITVKSSTPVDVQILGRHSGKLYVFADWKAVSGTQEILFDVPSDVTSFNVVVGDQVWHANKGDVVNLDVPARAASRANSTSVDATKFTVDKVTTYPTAHVTSDLLPYGSNVYYGAIKPIKDEASDNFYDDQNHAYKDPNGGKIHWWRGHGQYMPATLMKQIVGTTQDFYSDRNVFKDTNIPRVFCVTGTVPSVYIHHVRKSLNYEFGIMIGDKLTLNESDNYYCIPMFTSEGMDLSERNQILRLTRKDFEDKDENFSTYTGATFDFYFNENKVRCNGKEFIWNFDTDEAYATLKEKIENLSVLYGTMQGKVRMLPLPIDLADAERINPSYTGNIVEYKDNETGKDFYESYQEYLKWCRDNTLGTWKDTNYDELLGLKEFLGTRGYMMSEDDIPVVTKMTDADGKEKDGCYIVRFPMAKMASGWADLKESDVADNGLYAKMDDKYTVYEVMNGGVALDPNHVLGNDYVFYVKNLDITEGNPGWLVTTADGNILRTSPKMYGMGADATPFDTDILCWDVNNDGIYNDIAFTQSSTGAGGSLDRFTWILACEDLGGTGDYDFNDLVVAVKYVSSNKANEEPVEFYPLAAGGIYPIYLMYNELYKENDREVKRTYIVGKELHEWLGKKNEGGELPFINTGDDFPYSSLTGGGHRVQFNYQSGFSNNHFADLMGDIKTNQNQNTDANKSFAGFWVLVDRNNVIATEYVGTTDSEGNTFEIKEGMNEIKDMAAFEEAIKDCETVVAAAAQSGTAVPMMMVLGSDWEWPKETFGITSAYGEWATWLKNRNTHWYGQNQTTYKFADVDRSNVTKRPDITKAMESQD